MARLLPSPSAASCSPCCRSMHLVMCFSSKLSTVFCFRWAHWTNSLRVPVFLCQRSIFPCWWCASNIAKTCGMVHARKQVHSAWTLELYRLALELITHVFCSGSTASGTATRQSCCRPCCCPWHRPLSCPDSLACPVPCLQSMGYSMGPLPGIIKKYLYAGMPDPEDAKQAWKFSFWPCQLPT